MEVGATGGPPRLRTVLAQAWAIVRARWHVLLLGAAVVFVPAGLLEAVSEDLQEPLADIDAIDAGTVVEIVVALLALAVFAMLGDVVYAGVVAAVVVAEREGSEQPLHEVLSHLPIARLIGADLLLGLVIAIGFLLLIVPGLVFLTWFALVAPVVKIERLRLRAAFRRSRELVRQQFWLVFGIVIPVVLVSGMLSGFAGSAVESALGDTFAGHWLVATLTEVITAPAFALAVVVLYFELRGTEPSAARSA
jgi:hypothetical protein